MLAISCTNEEKITVTASPTTSTGKPASFDGPLRITVQSGDGTFTQDAATPLAFDAVSGDKPGDTIYLVEGDADLGAGVVEISDLVTLTVNGAQAANFGLQAAAPVAK